MEKWLLVVTSLGISAPPHGAILDVNDGPEHEVAPFDAVMRRRLFRD